MLLKLLFLIQFFTAILTSQILTAFDLDKIKISFQSVFSSIKTSKNTQTFIFIYGKKTFVVMILFSFLFYTTKCRGRGKGENNKMTTLKSHNTIPQLDTHQGSGLVSWISVKSSPETINIIEINLQTFFYYSEYLQWKTCSALAL